MSNQVCMPRQPLRCWQYTFDSEDVPLWLVPFIHVDEGCLEFKRVGDDESPTPIEDGDWLVELSDNNVEIWRDKDFREEFDIQPEAAPRE